MTGNREYGARIERGIVSAESNGYYRVRSSDRDGVETGDILSNDGTAYEVGDQVYFFMFDDGTGMIIGAF